MEIPQWLTSEFIQKCLPEEELNFATLHLGPASKAGDNYLSTIYRLKIQNKKSVEFSLIVKAILETPDALEFINALKAFPKETKMYQEILPDYARMWEEYTGERISFSPRCYFATVDPLAVIVMEDLKALGYVMRDRRVGMSLEEFQLVLTKVAKFHACSVKRSEQLGPYDKDLFDGSLGQLQSLMEDYYRVPFKEFLWTVEEHIENGTKYLPKLKSFQGKQYQIIDKIMALKPDQFNILGHCDLWINNLMFNRDHDDVLFLDYQITQWTPPASDLFYVLIANGSARTIIDHWDDLIKIYHSALVQSLGALKCQTKAPTLSEFHEDLDNAGPLAAVYTAEALALTKADPALNLDVDLLTIETPEAEAVRRKLYSDRVYLDELQLLLPFLDKKGYLDMKE